MKRRRFPFAPGADRAAEFPLKIRLVAGSVIFLSAFFPGISSDFQVLAPQRSPVEFVFRSLQPGETLLAELKENQPVMSVTIGIQDRKYILRDDGTARRPFALIGLDVDLKPEPLIVSVRASRPDGTADFFREELVIEPKDFQKRTFRISEAMLVPPPGEQERVMREQELTAAVYAIVTPEWKGKGPFLSPLSDREAFPNFGQRRVYNRIHTSVHQGVDIPAPWGTPVRASNSGTVVLASSLYLTGGTVIIDHGRGVFSLYCHMSKLAVRRGDRIGRGGVIGKVGNTGRSTGPHLHWGVRILGSRVDPFSLVGLPLE